MKLNLSFCRCKSIVSSILFFIFIFLNCFSSSAQTIRTSADYPFAIPSGEKVYSMDYKLAKGLQPYRKEKIESFGEQKTQIIEEGDFVIKTFTEDGKLKKDTSHFAIVTTRINGKDTVKTIEKKDFKIDINFRLICDLKIKEDSIVIIPDPSHKINYLSNVLHPTDENLYFKLQPGEKFKFNENTVGLSLISIPFKVRIGGSNTEVEETLAQARINNVGILLGYKSKSYKYRNSKLKKLAVTIGPFIGPTAVKLARDNISNPGDEISRMGIQTGIGILGEINRWNIGVSVGAESISDETGANLTMDNSLFLGLVFGYSLIY